MQYLVGHHCLLFAFKSLLLGLQRSRVVGCVCVRGCISVVILLLLAVLALPSPSSPCALFATLLALPFKKIGATAQKERGDGEGYLSEGGESRRVGS